MFPQGNPSAYNTSALNQQNVQLLGTPQIQNASGGIGSFNTTAPASSPGIDSMIRALKGGTQ